MGRIGECPMGVFTMAQLRTIMREAAGEVEVGDAEVGDTSYADLGFDSLAVLEISVRIKQLLGLQLPDAALAVTSTPAQTVLAVNELLAPEEVTA